MEKSVLVAGCGKSGIGATKLLCKKNEAVILYDGNVSLNVNKIGEQLEGITGYKIILGELTEEIIRQVKYCVISPGIPMDVPFVIQLQNAGIPIWSEIELAYHYGKGKIVAITGTNGKTTTTSLVGEIMQNWLGKSRAFVVGNIGIPYTEQVLDTSEDSVTVAEISSFQLETAISFHPNVSAILNITPDHLNRHKTMECYIGVKESITKNQTEEDFCVLNYDDEVLRTFGESLRPKVVYFSSTKQLSEGLCMDGNKIVFRHNGETITIGEVNEFHLVGQCNYENIMAAFGIAYCMGVPSQIIIDTIKAFRAVEHRIEFVAVKKGVTYYNDSKGTNVDAAIQGVKAMTSSTILIGGGYDKGAEFDPWMESFQGKIKKLILLGQTAGKIAECARKHNFTEIAIVDNLEEAVKLASTSAKEGDAVLLSPACASWGMFPNYEVRGVMFKEYVYALQD